MRATAFWTLTALSLGVAGYAIVVYAFLPLGVALHPDMRAAFETQRVAVYLHVFAAAFAMALGPFQFWQRLRTERPALHRLMGKLYLGIGVLVGGLAGFAMAFNAFGGLPARIGFGVLALLWLYTGGRAYAAIRRRDVASHRCWMVRNFALTFAAVTLRLWVPAAVVSGAPFEAAYAFIAWLCWVPNLVVAELAWNRKYCQKSAVTRANRASPGEMLP